MDHPPLWRARTEALTHLRKKQKPQIETIDALFLAVDECIDTYELHSTDNTYARVCGLTLLKAKNLALGSYSLILDGLAQEAGALLRPFIEYTELLIYLRKHPTAVEAALSGTLPKAGLRARAVGSMYKSFREHLNEHASHSAYSSYSLAHLQEPGTLRFKKLQKMAPEVLERNSRDFAIQLWLLLQEAILSLQHISGAPREKLAMKADDIQKQVLRAFNFGSPQ